MSTDKVRKIRVPAGSSGELCALEIGVRIITGRTASDVENNRAAMEQFGYWRTGSVEEHVGMFIGRVFCVYDADKASLLLPALAKIKEVGGVHLFPAAGLIDTSKKGAK